MKKVYITRDNKENTKIHLHMTREFGENTKIPKLIWHAQYQSKIENETYIVYT
jgi:hypothetical protein